MHLRITAHRYIAPGGDQPTMKPNLRRAERALWTLLGMVIVGVGVFGLLTNTSVWIAAFVVGVGLFTVYEGVSGWSLVRAVIRS